MNELREEQLEEKALIVAETQNELNILACKNDNWTKLPFHWDLCILNESSGEGIGSTGFEHWKPSELDLENLKVEMVDTGHFLASYIISKENVTYCQTFFTYVFKAMENCLDGDIINSFKIDDFKTSLKRFTLVFLTIDLGSYDEWIDENLKNLAEKFAYMLLRAGLNVDEFNRRYFIKNTLNICRQHLGLSEGDYVKVYEGQEDNVHIEKLAQEIEAKNGVLENELMNAYKDWYMYGPHTEAK